MSRILIVSIMLALLISLSHAQEIVVYEENFEGVIGVEWSRTTTSMTPIGSRQFLGEFHNDSVILSLTNLPQHSDLTIAFDLFIINSWDGVYSLGEIDNWKLGIDSTDIFWTTFDNQDFYTDHYQTYPDQFAGYPGTLNSPRTGASENNSLGYMYNSQIMDAVYNLTFSIPHTNTNATFEFVAFSLEGGIADESWGIDNVVVSLTSSNNNSSKPNNNKNNTSNTLKEGGMRLTEYCQSLGYVQAYLTRNDAYSWVCEDNNGHWHNIDMIAVCEHEYSGELPHPGLSDIYNPNTWKCYSHSQGDSFLPHGTISYYGSPPPGVASQTSNDIQSPSTSIQPQLNTNDWRIGNNVTLCIGTEIRHGSGLQYDVYTTVPTGGLNVRIINGPRIWDNYVWWDVSQQDGKTGWVRQDQADCTPEQPIFDNIITNQVEEDTSSNTFEDIVELASYADMLFQLAEIYGHTLPLSISSFASVLSAIPFGFQEDFQKCYENIDALNPSCLRVFLKVASIATVAGTAIVATPVLTASGTILLPSTALVSAASSAGSILAGISVIAETMSK